MGRMLVSDISWMKNFLIPHVVRRLNTYALSSNFPDGAYQMPVIKEKIIKGYDYCDGIDVERCKGNFMVMKNGNIMLDLHQQNGMLPLGHNNDELFNTTQQNHGKPQKDDVGNSEKYFELMEKTLLALLPQGMTETVTLSKGIDPLKKALQSSVNRFRENRMTKWDSSYPGFHENEEISGRCFSTLSLQSSLLPTISCPYHVRTIQLPLQGPPSERKCMIDEREVNCLESCFEMIKEGYLTMKHPTALVIEATRLAQNVLSDHFYQSLQAICTEFDVAFIVNEMDTFLAVTGHLWAHTKWNLVQPPDVVVFGKRMLNSGFYSKPGYLTAKVEANLNRLCDVSGLMKLEGLLKYVTDNNLLTQVAVVSQKLKCNMLRVQESYPQLIENISCNGLLCSIDFFDEDIKQEADVILINKGLNFGRNTFKSLTLNPSLVLTENHAQYVGDCLTSTLNELNKKLSVKMPGINKSN